MARDALGKPAAISHGSMPVRPRIRSIEDGRRLVHQALSLLESIPPWMAAELTTEVFRVAKWRAEVNMALVLDAIARDERPRPSLKVVRSS